MTETTITGTIPDVRTDYSTQMIRIKQHMHVSVQDNFVEGGRPVRWKELKKDGSPSHLHQTGRMMAGIRSESDEVSATTRAANWPGMFIHQFGGWAGRGHRSYLPARPYMLLQDTDKEYAMSEVSASVFMATERDNDKWNANRRLAGIQYPSTGEI